jgi:diacylglycerol O-acyltransferase / wax synthase
MSNNKVLTPGDAFFLMIESDKTPSQIGSLARMKLPPNADKNFILDMVEGFRKYQPAAAPYNLKLAKITASNPMYAWETVDRVDINYHLRHSALPYPGGERELAILISRLHSIPLDHNRPMWEFHIIEGLEDNCFAIYSKMHHALIDGVAGSRLLQQWMSQTEPKLTSNFVPFWAMPLPKRPPKTKQSAAAEMSRQAPPTLLEKISGSIKSAAGVFDATLESILGSRSKKHPGLVAPYSAPECMLNVPVGPQRRVSTVVFKTERLLAIGKRRNGTLNDVVMAICGGALRGYLIEQNGLPSKSLVSQVPVSFRAKDDLGGGNSIGMVLASLGTNESDTLARFDKVKASMSAGKDLLRNMDALQITAYSALMTLPFSVGQMTGFGNRKSRPMSNVVISNVPGPREKRYLNGAEVINVHPVSFVMQGQALNITLFTYADQITFVFTACRESLPSVQRLVDHTTEALEALEHALNIAPKTPTPKKTVSARKKPLAKKPGTSKAPAKKPVAKKPVTKKKPLTKAAPKTVKANPAAKTKKTPTTSK